MPAFDPTSGWLPLTLPQYDFWEEFSFHPDQPLSTVAHYLDIRGKVNEEALIRAITLTMREAEILTVRFCLADDGKTPLQRCDPQQPASFRHTDLRAFPDPFAEALRRMTTDIHSKLDLLTDNLSENALLRVGDERYIWYIRAHHIIVDGYSLVLMEQRCSELYDYFCDHGTQGRPFHSFASFLAEEESYRRSSRWQADRIFWMEYLRLPDSLPVIDKGMEDYASPSNHALEPLSGVFSGRLQEHASTSGIGWPDLLVLLSGLYLFYSLPRKTGENADALTLWLPFMSRWGSVGAHMPALLLNILPFRLSVEPEETMSGLLTRCAGILKKQRLHGRYRIEQIAADHGLAAGSRFFFSPLINVLPFNSPFFRECEVSRHVLTNGSNEGFSLTFRGETDAGGLTVAMDVDLEVADPEAFERHRKALPAFLAYALAEDAQSMPVARLWSEFLADAPRG